MARLPKFHGGISMTEGDIRRLKLWIKREGWTKKRSQTHGFQFESKMPMNMMAPEVPLEARREGSAKFVCPLCGYCTSVTDVCRSCPEMPATEKMMRPIPCYAHGTGEGDDRIPRVHRIKKDGQTIWVDHEVIGMVCVASEAQRLAEETGESREILVGAMKIRESRKNSAKTQTSK